MNDATELEHSPRSKFRKFFGCKDSKKEKAAMLNAVRKIYQNESSQTSNNIERRNNNVENLEEKGKKDSHDGEKKTSSPFLSEGEPEKLPPNKETKKLIEGELNPKRITALINNSIKEAVRSMVHDGVCDFIESRERPDSITKNSKEDEAEKSSKIIEDATLAKENSKDKSTYLTSEEKNTFDSHSQHPTRVRKLPSPYKQLERINGEQCNRSLCPAYNLEEMKKSKKNKRTKRKAHFSTDNRRMTGNVNIYICSEANENTKCKSQDKNKVIGGSESSTDIKSSESSASSQSTTKLVNAMKKKRKNKLNAQALACLCEKSEENNVEDTQSSVKRISEVPNNEITSSFTRVDNLKDDISSTELADTCSLKNCPAFATDTYSNYQYSSHNDNNMWESRRNSVKNYSFLTAERDEEPVGDTRRESVDACKCSKPNWPPYCACENEKKLTTTATNYPERGESITICTREPITKEEENKCCECKKESMEELPVYEDNAVVLDNEEEIIQPIKVDTTESIAPVTEANENESTLIEKEITPDESKLVPAMDNNPKESFLLRSWKRAMTFMRRSTSPASKVESDEVKIPEKQGDAGEPKPAEAKIQSKKSSSSTLPSSQSIKKDEASKLKKSSGTIPIVTSSQAIGKDKNSSTKIVSKISSKQKAKEITVADEKIPSRLNLVKPEIQPSLEKLKKPEDENRIKLVPCPFLQPEEPQQTGNDEDCCITCNKVNVNCDCCRTSYKFAETGQCTCTAPIPKTEEPTCCSCEQQVSCCTCIQRPIFRSPKSCHRVCRFCCNPLNRCTCRAPIRKCSYCGMSSDICNCHEGPLWTEGRLIMIPEKNNGIHVTAWKPRADIAAYFSREKIDLQGNQGDCYCDKNKPCGSDELPYQKLNVFSNVMNELQKKISDSVDCNRCNNTLCCCPKLPNCLSTIQERPSSQYRRNSPVDCQCPRSKGKIKAIAICHNCRTSPCRCRKDKRPQAKCFYCKTMPCRCEWKNKEEITQVTEPRTTVNPRSKRLRECRCPSPKKILDNSGDNYMQTQKHR